MGAGILNEYNEYTEKIVHLVVTTKCDRRCPWCSNKYYDLRSLPHVSDNELSRVETVFLTGGEPFAYSNPCLIAEGLKKNFSNIKEVIVYTSAAELYYYLLKDGIYSLDGITISIKNLKDKVIFDKYLAGHPAINNISSKYLYVFNYLNPETDMSTLGYTVLQRKWQKDGYVPSPNSFFRLL